ncbi:CheR family methyltransferase [Legionella sp. D16C41]|uniref:CheR family methyltransferase n=1 Tax=Legionella sp. D16C41 TaxID=3402688 RepID=UPI003AF8A06E
MLKLEKWANQQYGLLIYNHTYEQIKNKLEDFLIAKNLTENSLFQGLYAGDLALIKPILSILTVPESYFFRDQAVYNYLEKIYLPKLIAEKRLTGSFEINIWSAGCARGEEIYSIAILLASLLPDLPHWKLNLIGTDINEITLTQAKEALFTKRSIHTLKEEFKEKYFFKQGNLYGLVHLIRQMVDFSYFNLAKPYLAFNNYDLIFCRNVLMYLTKEVIDSALDTFYQSLNEDGLLFLGLLDSNPYQQEKFITCVADNVFFLKKKPIEKRAQVSQLTTTKPKKLTSESTSQTMLALIKSHLENKNYNQALEKINLYLTKWPKNGLILRYKGECLLEKNNLAAALTALIESTKLDPLDPISYFLKGLIEIDYQQPQAAKISMQRALYLKNTFPEAAYYLGLIYLQIGQSRQGVHWLKKSLHFATKLNENSILYTLAKRDHFINAVTKSISYYERLKDE